MKAFRNIGGSVVEIDVDTDPNGQPILPPDTTVDAKPAAHDGLPEGTGRRRSRRGRAR